MYFLAIGTNGWFGKGRLREVREQEGRSRSLCRCLASLILVVIESLFEGDLAVPAAHHTHHSGGVEGNWSDDERKRHRGGKERRNKNKKAQVGVSLDGSGISMDFGRSGERASHSYSRSHSRLFSSFTLTLVLSFLFALSSVLALSLSLIHSFSHS